MAQVGNFCAFMGLREQIRVALDDIFAPKHGEFEQAVTICISPLFDEVYATFENWWDDDILADRIRDNWHFETATNYLGALDISEIYFGIDTW